MRKYYIIRQHWTIVGDVYTALQSEAAAHKFLSEHRQAEIFWEGTHEEYITKIDELKKSGIQVY